MTTQVRSSSTGIFNEFEGAQVEALNDHNTYSQCFKLDRRGVQPLALSPSLSFICELTVRYLLQANRKAVKASNLSLQISAAAA